MKKLRSGLEIKKSIINLLKQEKEISLRRLDIKLNTSSQTVLMHCKELEYLRIIRFLKHKRNDKNGKPFTTVVLTDYGRNL